MGLFGKIFGKQKRSIEKDDRSSNELEKEVDDPVSEELEILKERLTEMRVYQKEFMDYREHLDKTADEILSNKHLSREDKDIRIKDVVERVAEIKKMEQEFNDKMAVLKKRTEEIRKREFT